MQKARKYAHKKIETNECETLDKGVRLSQSKSMKNGGKKVREPLEYGDKYWREMKRQEVRV